MKKGIKVITTLFVLGIVIAVGYSIKNDTSKEVEPIKIGLIAGLSGEYSSIGENHVKGVSLAKKVYLEENPETRVELIIEDDQFDSKQGVSAYKKLVEIDKVDALINMTSPTINAIYDLAIQANIPIIQSGEQGQDPVDDNIFQMLPGNIELERELGEYVKNLGLNNIVLVYSNEPTWIRFTKAFKDGYKNELTSLELNLQEKEFRTIATKIAQMNPSVIVFLGNAEQGAILIKDLLRFIPGKPQFIFDASFQAGFTNYQKILGDLSLLDGSIVMTVKNTASENFIKLYRKEYGEDPGMAADFMYDSFMLLMQTYNFDNKEWIKNIKNTNSEGVSGSVKFDEFGVRTPQTEMKIITNGKLK